MSKKFTSALIGNMTLYYYFIKLMDISIEKVNHRTNHESIRL